MICLWNLIIQLIHEIVHKTLAYQSFISLNMKKTTEEPMFQYMEIFFFYLLEQYRKADVYFLEHMIKSDKNWVNDISRETKIDSIIWKHSSLINLTTQIQDSTKYLMSNGFYDAKGMLQMNLMLHGQTVNISWNTKQIVGSYSAKQTEWRGQLCQKMSSCSMTMPPKKKKNLNYYG